MSHEDARIVLAELEGRPDLASNARLVAVQLKRALSPKAAELARFSQRRAGVNATSSATTGPSSSAVEIGTAQHSEREPLTTADAAARLGITPNAVRELRRRGVIQGERIGGRWQFDAADIERRAKRKE